MDCLTEPTGVGIQGSELSGLRPGENLCPNSCVN